MKRLITISLLLAALNLVFAQDIPAYKIYDQDGKAVTYSQMLDKLSEADFVFFGELHNNPIAHWMEVQITKSLYNQDKRLILGAEMFEADVQLILDEYLSGYIREKDVKNEARVWPNYPTDYKPLLVFAHDHNLRFIATNIPRRYANLVYRKGFGALEKLSDQAKQYIAPLPIKYDPELDCYKNMTKGMVHMGMPVNPNIAKAQAIKDATMAYFISKNWQRGYKFIHYNGSYHSDNFQGIVWYLKALRPQAKIMTITTVEQKDVKKLSDESLGKANFIIVVPEDMTKTY